MELGELEKIAAKLSFSLGGSTVEQVLYSHWYQQRIKSKPQASLDGLKHATLDSLRRVGKGLVFTFETQKDWSPYIYLGNRLGMNSFWQIHPVDHTPGKGWAVTIIFKYSIGRTALVYCDSRRSGQLEVRNNLQSMELFRGYGPDLFSTAFSKEWVEFFCSRHWTAIKPLLLEQKYCPGMSNWLACEILFLAHIHPETPAKTLSKIQISRLFEAIHVVSNSLLATNKEKITHVYEKSECGFCHSEIAKAKQNRRPTYYCPRCQDRHWKPPEPVSEDLARQICDFFATEN